jgi:selenoprotein W-related protein
MDELLGSHQHQIAELTFVPSTGGVFEVAVNGENVFSKKALGRFPESGEVTGIIRTRQGWE